MSEFRASPERRFIINDSPLIPTASSSSTRIYADSIERENIELTIVYSNDFEHPSLINFIVCGLCLCPAVKPEADYNLISTVNRNLSKLSSMAVGSSIPKNCGDDDDYNLND